MAPGKGERPFGASSSTKTPPPGSGPPYTPPPGGGSGPAAPPPLDDEPDPLVGTVLDGKYDVLSKLGHGGMGSVYRARHRLLDRDVALKVIARSLANDKTFRSRFFREARIAHEFVHPHAVPLRDFGATPDGLFYMTMDYCAGTSLRAVLEQEGALPTPRAVRIVRDILAAVAEAHRKHIVHRDLKPDNIMLEADEPQSLAGGFVKVLDFGLAKIAHGHGSAERQAAPGEPGAGGGRPGDQRAQKTEEISLAEGARILGTPSYMSPEQACGDEIDGRSDLYAIGIILYQLLMGELPFKAPSSRQVILKQIAEPPPPFAKVRPDLRLPAGLEDVVRKALAKDPADRYRTAEELAAVLLAYETETPVSAPAVVGVVGSGSVAGMGSTAGMGSGAGRQPVGPGSVIDRYKVLAPIAEGGFGAVWRAEHVLMHRECALKIMKPNLVVDHEFIARFHREAQVAARFKHPNAVEVYDFGQFGENLFFMAMELLRGESLKERLFKVDVLSIKDAVEVLCQILDVLGAAHDAGIVHRDLKPENVMLQTVDGWPNQVKVLDFGVAKMRNPFEEAGNVETLQGSFFGTPQYSSPEQCRGEPVDNRSDLYSAGMILYQILSGVLPFEASTPQGFIAHHMVTPILPLRRAAPPDVAIPESLERLLTKALEKRRVDRFQSAVEFAESLRIAAGVSPIFEMGASGVKLASPLRGSSGAGQGYPGEATVGSGSAGGSRAAVLPGRASSGSGPAAGTPGVPGSRPAKPQRPSLFGPKPDEPYLPTPGSHSGADDFLGPDQPEARVGRRRVALLATAIFVAVVLGGGDAIYRRLNPPDRPPP